MAGKTKHLSGIGYGLPEHLAHLWAACSHQYNSPISTLPQEHLTPKFPKNPTGDKHVPSNVLANPVKENMATDAKYTVFLARG